MGKIARVPWRCPQCGIGPNGCFKQKDKEKCQASRYGCMGFICDCSHETGKDHGETYGDPCPEATCYHCGWSGTYPKVKTVKSWEKKALEAGWQPPAGWQP